MISSIRIVALVTNLTAASSSPPHNLCHQDANGLDLRHLEQVYLPTSPPWLSSHAYDTSLIAQLLSYLLCSRSTKDCSHMPYQSIYLSVLKLISYCI